MTDKELGQIYNEAYKAVYWTVTKDATTIFDSKIGGVPYFPKTMEYPRGKSEDQRGSCQTGS